jgi:hypothetical protein
VARCRCRVMLAATLLSHAGDGTAEATWPQCDVVSSHAGDGAAEVTWSWHDVPTESCWRWRCRGDLAMAQCRCRVMLAIALPR